MTHIRCIIIDDEPLAREKLKRFCEKDGDMQILGEFENAEDAIAAIPRLRPTLIFLDIEMPGSNGFSVVQSIPAGLNPIIIFTTAFDNYALKAFEVHATDYLLKPFDRDRFSSTIAHARTIIEERSTSDIKDQLDTLLKAVGTKKSFIERIPIKINGRIIIIEADDIDWLEAAGNYIKLHVGQHIYLHRATMHSIGEQLDPSQFARIHRCTIVNISRIREFQSWFNGEYKVILKNSTELMMSRGYRDELARLTGVYQESE